eukprot:10326661-Alexandrium_andersonii.AAC.1
MSGCNGCVFRLAVGGQFARLEMLSIRVAGPCQHEPGDTINVNGPVRPRAVISTLIVHPTVR